MENQSKSLSIIKSIDPNALRCLADWSYNKEVVEIITNTATVMTNQSIQYWAPKTIEVYHLVLLARAQLQGKMQDY